MFEFDAQTGLSETRPGTFAGELAPGWSVGGGINGGYLLALMGKAVRTTIPQKPDPIAVSAHYLSASVAGPAEITTRLIRDGGSIATVAVELVQAGQPRIAALATYGALGAQPDDVRTVASPPELPPVEECVSGAMAPPEVRAMAPLMDRFDLRFDPRCIGWAVGKPSGTGLLQGWFRLADGREPDPISLLMVVDALPPVTFDLGLPGWAPTLELTAHIRALPAPGWLRVRHETRNVAGGLFEEDCEVWDSTGRLVAQARQLARLPREASRGIVQ